jgi:hypothetical protein
MVRIAAKRRTIAQTAASPLKYKRFLVVEDEPMIALDIVAALESEV